MNWRLIKNQDGKTVLQKRVIASHPGAVTAWETVAEGREISELCNVLDHWEVEK
jgi:hypothetical protein